MKNNTFLPSSLIQKLEKSEKNNVLIDRMSTSNIEGIKT